jgi:hypothetical protein
MPDRFLHTAVAHDVDQQVFDRLLWDLTAAARQPEGSRPVG